MGFLYVDGHVRVYHGQHALPKAHVARMRISMPATSDYWVNDSSGDPLFVVRIDAEARQVIVGPREALLTHALALKETNWIGDGPSMALLGTALTLATENIGIEKLAEMGRGFIQIDPYGRTKSKGLWAIGELGLGDGRVRNPRGGKADHLVVAVAFVEALRVVVVGQPRQSALFEVLDGR